jgi:plasmid stabilization system protein ParE
VSLRLTGAVDHDIERILEDNLQLFGPRQFRAYTDLIGQALQCLAADPRGPGTSARADIGPGVRSLRLDAVARRRGAGSHCVYYLPPEDGRGSDVVVLRLLHDRMEPGHRVTSARHDDQEWGGTPSGSKP